MEIIFQVLGALLVLFVIFLTYMNTKTWRWVHVTFAFLVFAASAAFCVYAAMTLKTRAYWVKQHDTLEKQLATTEQDLEKTTRGDPNDVEHKTPSIVSVREELARTILDRGRVWRNCQVNIQPTQDRSVVVTVRTSPPADPSNPNPPPAKKHNIQPKTIVHAFREAEFTDPKEPEKVTVIPASYIGEFRAERVVDDQTLTLQPTMTPLAPDQLATMIAAMSQPGTWSLYETAPVDGHEWLVPEKDDKGNETVPPLAAAANVVAQRERQPFTPQMFEQMAQPYLDDGKELKDLKDPEKYPPEDIWYRVTFTQEYEVSVDAPVVNSIDADPFNTEGQAVLERLRRRGGATPEEGGKVMFGPKEGQIQSAVLDQQTAQQLIDRGICSLVNKIYRRKLTDYERRFHSFNDRNTEITSRIKQLDLDNKATLAAIEKAKEQQVLVEELKGKLNDDLTKAKYEADQLDKYLAALRGRLTGVQGELSQLYLANKALNAELARLTADLTEQIDRRTRAATARTP